MDIEKKFLEDGVVELGKILDINDCKNLKKQLCKLRTFTDQYFKENVFLRQNEFDENNSQIGTGPSEGRNITESINLDLIEKNPIVIDTLSKVLGGDYKIMQKICVMGLPTNMIPEWILNKTENLGFVNLCAYVKPEFRDMIYFHGIDYHMDLIDHRDKVGDFITLYVYLEDVTSNMSPVHIVPKSHIFGATTAPHEIQIKNSKLLYSDQKGKSGEFDNKELTGPAGSVFFWSQYTLHGTMPTPTTDTFRISIRYLIQRGKSEKECIIDKFLKSIDAPLSIHETTTKGFEYGTAKGTKLLKEKEPTP